MGRAESSRLCLQCSSIIRGFAARGLIREAEEKVLAGRILAFDGVLGTIEEIKCVPETP